jgi:glycosyltransferase involved in cell wall biosynthesis
MNKPTLTVFTPTYNRAHTLGRTYESLCHQTCKDFEWLIIDDGSTDNTRELVKDWMIVDNGFGIQYAYKENGGLHTGYNKAIELMDTELCVCIDSDDFMPDNAVEKIIETWRSKASNDVAGIIGLDYLLDGTPLGSSFPEIEKCHYYNLCFCYHHTEDVKFVTRTDMLKEVAPQPTYNGEKNFNPTYMYDQLDLQYEWILLNENICIVDYQQDGMANGIYKQYLNSPNSFAARRIQNFRIPAPLTFYIKQYIHLASSAIISNNYSWLMKAPYPLFSLFALPFGFILSLYIKYRADIKK